MERTAQRSTTFDALPVIPPEASKYEILGVSPQATPDELKVAYRRLAMLYHPDRHEEDSRDRAEQVFKRISAAYRTLSDEQERRRYDAALHRGEHFHEGAADRAVSGLAEILAGIDAYEHIFSEGGLGRLDGTLEKVVHDSLIDDLGEHIVCVWPMLAAPAGSTFKGSYKAGAVVLTNLRLLLPFVYTWEETQGNTKYRYTGIGGTSFPLPLITRFDIVSERRLRNQVWVDIQNEKGTTRFRPGSPHLGKLLLIARLWGIPVEARQEDAPAEELRWALFGAWKWALGLSFSGLVLAAVIGIFGDGFIATPVALTVFVVEKGFWQWMLVLCGAISGRRLWRWMMAFKQIEPAALVGGSADSTLMAS
jgi:hypothetical protein